MKLLTKEILKRLPKLGETSEQSDPTVQVKFFTPDAQWTWFGIEGNLRLVWYDARNMIIDKEVSDEEEKILCSLWQSDKKTTLPCSITPFDLWNYLSKSVNRKNPNKLEPIGSEQSGVEGRYKKGSRVYLCDEEKSSQAEQSRICKKSQFDNGKNNRPYARERRNGASSRRKSCQRQSREFKIDEERAASTARSSEINSKRLFSWLSPESETGHQQGWKGPFCEITDFIFFGYVKGLENELGTFSLRELKEVRGGMGLPVERDKFFKPCPLSKVMKD